MTATPRFECGSLGRMLFRAAGCAVVLTVLVLYGLAQARNWTAGTVENDCEGYIVLGKRLASGQPAGMVEPDPFVFQSHVWVENARGELLPKYDPGYPVLIGLFTRIGGDEAAFAVSPILGGLAIVGCLLLFRLWMHPFLALLAMLAFAITPMFQAYAGYALTHVPELAFLAWGAYFLWRWRRRPATGPALAAGLLLGYAATIRYTAILMAGVLLYAAAVTLFQGLRLRRDAIRPVTVLLLAYAVFPLLLALYHWRWFGHPLASGYALSGEQEAFGFRYLLANVATLNEGLLGRVAYLLFPLGLAGMMAGGPAHERVMRCLWFFGVYGVYAAYYWAPADIAYYRFMLAALPVMVGSAFLLAEAACRPAPWRHAAGVAIVVLYGLQVLPPLVRTAAAGAMMSTQARNQAAAARAIAPHLEPDAVLFLGAPMDLGMGVYRGYRAYRLAAFHPGFIDRAMPPWSERTTRAAQRRGERYRWPVMTQPSRREALAGLYRELGADGLARRRDELVEGFLRDSRQVAFLLPARPTAVERSGVTNVAFEARVTFDTPGYGSWTLHTVSLRDR